MNNRRTLYVKYMVSQRCKVLVDAELKELDLHPASICLGMIELLRDITQQQREALRIALLKSGLELMDDKDQVLIERAKNLIIEMIYYSDEMPEVNYSDYISDCLKCDYADVARIFSEVKGITMKQFIIINKIERAKELLMYNDLSLTEISHKLKYSSVAHLSHQFKKVTGHPPSFFKGIRRVGMVNNENAGIM